MDAGVRRCLGIFQSGRDFLQQLADIHQAEIGITTFFESLKSRRRLRLLDELLAQSRLTMRRDMPDAFSNLKSLVDFDLYAGDGHFIAAACHDTPMPRGSSAASETDPTTFWQPLLPDSQKGTPWLKVLKTLVVYRPHP